MSSCSEPPAHECEFSPDGAHLDPGENRQGSLLIVDRVRPWHVIGPLADHGWTVTWTAGLENLSNHDLLLVELRVGSQSAFDLLERLRGGDDQRPVVVWSAFCGIQVARDVVAAGARAFLPKPASWQQILSAFGRRELKEALSIQQAKMLYVEEVFALSGSVSRAAKNLGVDRRSFRRMLEKFSSSAPRDSAIARWNAERTPIHPKLVKAANQDESFEERTAVRRLG